MPRRNIYIRLEDEPIWQQIYSPDWLHAILQAEKDKLG